MTTETRFSRTRKRESTEGFTGKAFPEESLCDFMFRKWLLSVLILIAALMLIALYATV